jgi:hypothetical protein
MTIPTTSEPEKPKRPPNVAIIYVHGMGSQRRNEETSRLIDALDYYLVARSRVPDSGPTEGLKYDANTIRKLTETTYIRPLKATYLVREEAKMHLTFVEAYWAPEMSGVVTPGQVIKWMIRMTLIPISNLKVGWDKLARIRQNALITLLHKKFHEESMRLGRPRSKPYMEINRDIGRSEYGTLMRLYLYFNRADLTRDSPSFLRRFNEFIRTTNFENLHLDPEIPVQPIHVRTQADIGPNRFPWWLLTHVKHLWTYWTKTRFENQTVKKDLSRIKDPEVWKEYQILNAKHGLNDDESKQLAEKQALFERSNRRRLLRTEKRIKLLDLLSKWTWTFVRLQALVQTVVLGVWFTVLALILLTLWTCQNFLVLVLGEHRPSFLHDPLLGSMNSGTWAFWPFVLVAGLIIKNWFAIPEFLSNLLGDVMQWSTYNESQRYSENRIRVLELFKSVLWSVLDAKSNRPDRATGAKAINIEAEFDRVIVVAHSLGTAVVADSLVSIFNEIESGIGTSKTIPIELLGLQNQNKELYERYKRFSQYRRTKHLDRLTHLITLGSPIDKIFYFLESRPSEYAHHNYFMEQTRGDLKRWRDKGIFANMNWINIYDHSDIIAGPVFTFNTISKFIPSKGAPAEHVWNLPINHFTFGSLNRSHSTYFENTNVLETIWNAITEDVDARQGNADEPEFKSKFVTETYPNMAKGMPPAIPIQVFLFLFLCPLGVILEMLHIYELLHINATWKVPHLELGIPGLALCIWLFLTTRVSRPNPKTHLFNRKEGRDRASASR